MSTPDTPGPEIEPSFEVWEAAEEAVRADEALVVSLDGFEGPLDVLLALARTQKVDLAKISVLALAEQYLLFIAAGAEAAPRARRRLSRDGGLARLPQVEAAAAARGRHRRPADGRGAGGAAGLPPEAAGGHAQRGRHA